MKTIAATIAVSVLLLISCVTCVAEDPSPYFLTTLAKTFHSLETLPREEVEIMIRVITHTDIDPSNRKDSIAYALKYHDQLCDSLQRRGWHVIHPLSKKIDAGTLEITFQPKRKRMEIKTFIYPCGSDPLWNTMKYRGGSHGKYFDAVSDKAQECIMARFHVSN